MTDLTDEQIHKDNPHFGPVIRLIEEGPYRSKRFDFTFYRTVGAYDSSWEDEPNCKFDAWATYLWSPSSECWVLGDN